MYGCMGVRVYACRRTRADGTPEVSGGRVHTRCDARRERFRAARTWRFGLAAAAALCAMGAAGIAGCRHATPPAPAPPRIAGFPPYRVVTASERQGYVGSSACITCHPALAGQLATHHARTLAKVGALDARERFSRPSDVRDPVLGVTYRAAVRAGRCIITAAKNGRTWSAAPEYGFGSGEHGVTYAGTYEGTPVEMRITYYSQPRRWDYTPSQQPGSHAAAVNPVGRTLDPPVLIGCFG